jgi:hypothetical protein
MSLSPRLLVLLVSVAGALASSCDPPLPDAPKQCDPNAGLGCLSDEICVDFKCIPRPKCENDDDCSSPAFKCVLPAQICQLREGFGQECSEPDAPCGPGRFCALGVCRDVDDARACARRTDCPTGQKCDPVHFFCIPDAPCTLADTFAEVACDPDETCDALSGQCNLECQNECTVATVEQDCGPQQRCDGACRCVQCIVDDDCGPGLVCNSRAGRCQSENLCFSDDDCDPPLICGPSTQLCEVAPPACESDFDCPVAKVCDVGSGRCISPTGPCPSDRFEDADTPASAETLDVAPGGVELFDDLELCPNDDDVYAVVLSAGDVLTAIVTNTVPQARATMWLLDDSGETSLRFAETPPRGNGRLTYAAQVDETVFLRLTSIIAASPYDLTLERTPGAGICQADAFEGAVNNNGLLTATPPLDESAGIFGYVEGTPAAGTICPGDVDLYRVDVKPGEALKATLSFDGVATDLDLAFLDGQGNIVEQSAGTNEPEQIRRRFVAGGSVYVRVRGFGNDTGDYTLLIEREPPFACTADAAEPDNTAAQSVQLGLNASLPPLSRTVCQDDVDLITAPLEDFERLVVKTTYDDSDLELTIDILDATGTTVLATSPPATGGAALSYDARGNETVLVRIRGTGGGIGAYTLSVDKENQLSCAPDAREPNNTVSSSVALPPANELLSICSSDQDFFTVDGTAGKTLVVDLSFRQAEGDLDLMLLGLDGQQILAVSDGTSDGEHLEKLLPLDGRYTIRVFSLTSGAKARYSLDAFQQ